MMTREEIIQNIRDCGQSIIDNAEKIANCYEYSMAGTEIVCSGINEHNSLPYIEVINRFYPEGLIKRYST